MRLVLGISDFNHADGEIVGGSPQLAKSVIHEYFQEYGLNRHSFVFTLIFHRNPERSLGFIAVYAGTHENDYKLLEELTEKSLAAYSGFSIQIHYKSASEFKLSTDETDLSEYKWHFMPGQALTAAQNFEMVVFGSLGDSSTAESDLDKIARSDFNLPMLTSFYNSRMTGAELDKESKKPDICCDEIFLSAGLSLAVNVPVEIWDRKADEIHFSVLTGLLDRCKYPFLVHITSERYMGLPIVCRDPYEAEDIHRRMVINCQLISETPLGLTIKMIPVSRDELKALNRIGVTEDITNGLTSKLFYSLVEAERERRERFSVDALREQESQTFRLQRTKRV